MTSQMNLSSVDTKLYIHENTIYKFKIIHDPKVTKINISYNEECKSAIQAVITSVVNTANPCMLGTKNYLVHCRRKRWKLAHILTFKKHGRVLNVCPYVHTLDFQGRYRSTHMTDDTNNRSPKPKRQKVTEQSYKMNLRSSNARMNNDDPSRGIPQRSGKGGIGNSTPQQKACVNYAQGIHTEHMGPGGDASNIYNIPDNALQRKPLRQKSEENSNGALTGKKTLKRMAAAADEISTNITKNLEVGHCELLSPSGGSSQAVSGSSKRHRRPVKPARRCVSNTMCYCETAGPAPDRYTVQEEDLAEDMKLQQMSKTSLTSYAVVRPLRARPANFWDSVAKIIFAPVKMLLK